MNQFLTKWVEQYLFFPNPFQKIVSICMFPLTIIYCVITAYKRISKKPFDFGIPIISIGNLVVGGTGKTPLAIALAKDKKDAAIILRGYGRESKGLFVVSKNGKILEDVKTSGDEAMVLALSLPKATIIVSENRVDGILKARELGSKVVFLDDGYSKHEILKYDILIRPKEEPTNIFCLPSGGYRDTKMMYAFTDLVLKDSEDFQRIVTFKKNGITINELPKKLLLLTAISKPNRLLEFLPNDIKVESFADHYNFTKDDIDNIQKTYQNYSIVTTLKDMVKLEKFKIDNIYLMDLEILINDESKSKIEEYVTKYNQINN
ncbi:MAG: tetraacyldisaccharide 4'-kinase [Campylobacterota bacterium]|nr:tetraacyldisaccharide 4'-kinase [Campylobacterota bacterium]